MSLFFIDSINSVIFSMSSWRQKYYDCFSKYYDRFVALHASDAGGSLRGYLADQTGALNDDRVLDICSGTGSLLIKLKEKTGTGGLVVGVDFSIGMLKAAKEKVGESPSVCLVRADVSHLPFRKAVFDAVTCSHAFYELKGHSQDACLKEISRTLKPAKPFLPSTSYIHQSSFDNHIKGAGNFERGEVKLRKEFIVKTNGIVAIKALSNKISRASYYIMRDQLPFDEHKLFR